MPAMAVENATMLVGKTQSKQLTHRIPESRTYEQLKILTPTRAAPRLPGVSLG